jgi:hypothetical protein
MTTASQKPPLYSTELVVGGSRFFVVRQWTNVQKVTRHSEDQSKINKLRGFVAVGSLEQMISILFTEGFA